MLNETLRLLRIIHDIKAKDLATRLDISPSFLSEIETGKKDPSIALLNKYSAVFNIKLSTLFLFTEDNQVNSVGKTRTRDALFRFIKYIESVEQVDEAR